jgi:bifunctional non-homologous end joining protein LigD
MPAKKMPATAGSGGTDRTLARYHSMRDFNVTAEPRGSARSHPQRSAATALPFVIQKHAATRLHYDFRLGWNGVLKSWAVTKGPSYFPGDKRLAVQVEDHPMEYGDFEGTIPKGQYGGGTVMVWDTGTWEPHGDVDRGLKDGNLKFELHGTKLKGNWALIRMHGIAGGSDKANWLLIKEKDAFAWENSDKPITEAAPNSATTGRSIEEIASSNGRVWDSSRRNGRAAGKTDLSRQPVTASIKPNDHKKKATLDSDLSSAPRERFPGFIAPQLAQQAATAPSSSQWEHELKLDGYRIQIHVRPNKARGKHSRKVQLLTRKGLDWTARMPDIADAAARLNVESAILDGEAVALDERGVSDFAALQAAFHEGRQRFITYFAFDILHLNGHNLRNLPLTERRGILAELLDETGEDSPIRLSESLAADGKEVFKNACTLGAEGIVSKLATSKYSSGRGSSWLKVKCHLEQEFVVGGFTLPSKGDVEIGALLLGYYDGGKLRYAGRSGTGFTQKTHRTIRAMLERLKRKDSPFAEVPRDVSKTALWVKPELVAQIVFSTWTRDNLVRQAAFKGLREDKPAKEVVRERAMAPSEAKGDASTRKDRARPRAQRDKRGGKAMTELAITHPEKVLDEESGMTKRDLAEYYIAVAGNMLPHISNRPLSVVRCPEGNRKPCFFQKHVGLGLPSGVKSVSIRNPKNGEKEDFLTVDSSDGLVGLAQMGVLEIHPWGAQNDSLDRPDRVIFDLDPDAAIDWATLAETARELRRRIKKLGLESFVKTTGGKGLHVVIPIEAQHEWPAIKDFAYRLVLKLEKEKPDLYVTKMTKATRKNRIYLDYLRNDRESTAVAPYSPRARARTPVAMPLRWNELDAATAPAFHVSDFANWRSRLRHDPWTALLTSKQRLSNKVLRAAGEALPSRAH